MLPKVTLIGSEDNFSMQFGTAAYTFNPRQTVEVPVAVALSLRGKKNKKGKSLFKVMGLPLIISSSGSDQKQPRRQRL